MIILFIILAIIAAIILIVLLAAAFTKSDYEVERQITINKPVSQVFGYVRYLKNMDNYNKWVMRDPMARKDYRGQDGTVGFAYAWDGDKQAGQGEQLITKIEDARRIDVQIAFIRPFAAVSDSYMITEPTMDNTTVVKWGFASKMPYPMNAIMIFMDMGEMLGKDLNESLQNLKQIIEKQP
ncbi:SRPBCC family protein [Mucilaginibacter psychrotolerans]|uniref:Polyketide cyclase n=1 Tax=Mucilaginibacter psychrotolerans TaxID=1524096 RepID=A0A4Y8SNJ5_9SPHI|nr:SRPBCC family protein [Mucilaginibacter psychrotolerans]TFF40137.1 polyketide cyclase [Mucilaginibacter psychrotolerans]